MKRIVYFKNIYIVCFLYLILSGTYGCLNLDVDEFSFIKEPYELLGGDYTVKYLNEGNIQAAGRIILKSYYFYWKYRPLFAPIISDGDKLMFKKEEKYFGYKKPAKIDKGDPQGLEKYSKRVIVPEPDRFYRHGAGKPLLPALLSIPQLALIKIITSGGKDLLYYQYNFNYHPIFILARLVQISAGLISVLLVFLTIKKHLSREKAFWGASIMAFFPVNIMFFPNLHHDSIMVPFLILGSHFFIQKQYIRSGIFTGLAMASKNVAIFLFPVFLLYFVLNIWTKQSNNKREVYREFALKIKQLCLVGGVSLLTLLPFANPISYGNEVLTPIIHRQYDQRGENPLVDHTVDVSHEENKSSTRPEVNLINTITMSKNIVFFFAIIGVFLLLDKPLLPISKLSLIMIFMALPYGLIFGYNFGYRSLMFVPFFCLLCADILRVRQIVWLLILLLAIDFINCVDPITTPVVGHLNHGVSLSQSISNWW